MAGLNPRMRLTIDVLPLTEENSHGPGQYRDLALAALKGRKFALPVQLDHTFEQVWAQIEERYKRNYLQPHEAACFTIKKLQDAYECDLDLSDTVAAIYEGELDPQHRLIKVVPGFVHRDFSVPFTSNLRPASAQKRHREIHGERSSKRRRIEEQEREAYHGDETQDQPMPSTESDHSNEERTRTAGSRAAPGRNTSRRSRSGASVVYVQDSQTGQIEFPPLVKEESPELGQPILNATTAKVNTNRRSFTPDDRNVGLESVHSPIPMSPSRQPTQVPLSEEDHIMRDDARTSKSPVSDTPVRQNSEGSRSALIQRNGTKQTSSPEPFGQPLKHQKTYSRRQSLRAPASAQKERSLRDSSNESTGVEEGAGGSSEKRGSARSRSFKMFQTIDDDIVSTPQAKQGRSTGDRPPSPRVVIPTPKQNITSKKALSALNSLVTGRVESISSRSESITPARDDPARSAKALQDFKQARGRPVPTVESTSSFTSQSAASGTPKPTSSRSQVPLPENVRRRFSHAGLSSSVSRNVSSPQPGLFRGTSREESPFYAKKTLSMVHQGRQTLANGDSDPVEAVIKTNGLISKATTSSSLRKPSKKFFDMPRTESPVPKRRGRPPGSKNQRQKALERDAEIASTPAPTASSPEQPQKSTASKPERVQEEASPVISSSSAAPTARKSSQRRAIPLPENVRHRFATKSPIVQTSNPKTPAIVDAHVESRTTQTEKSSSLATPAVGHSPKEPVIIVSGGSSDSSDDSDDGVAIDDESEENQNDEAAVDQEADATEVMHKGDAANEVEEHNEEQTHEQRLQDSDGLDSGQSVAGDNEPNERTLDSIDEDFAVHEQIRTESLPVTSSHKEDNAGMGDEEIQARTNGVSRNPNAPEDEHQTRREWNPQSWNFGALGQGTGIADTLGENAESRSKSITESNAEDAENSGSTSSSTATSTRSSPAASHQPARFLSRSPTSEKSMSEDDSTSASQAPDSPSIKANGQDAEDDSTASESGSTSSDDDDNESKDEDVAIPDAAPIPEPEAIPPSSPPPIHAPEKRTMPNPPAPSSSIVPSTSQPLPRASQSAFSGTTRYTPTPSQRLQPQSAVRSSQLLNGARRPTYQKYPNVKQQLLEERTRMKSAQKAKTFDPSTTSMGRLSKAKAKVDLSDGSDDDSSSTSSSSEDEVSGKRGSQNDAGCMVA